jgi:hypothetical protein
MTNTDPILSATPLRTSAAGTGTSATTCAVYGLVADRFVITSTRAHGKSAGQFRIAEVAIWSDGQVLITLVRQRQTLSGGGDFLRGGRLVLPLNELPRYVDAPASERLLSQLRDEVLALQVQDADAPVSDDQGDQDAAMVELADQAPAATAAMVWCDTHHEDGAHRLTPECVNGHFTGRYGADQAQPLASLVFLADQAHTCAVAAGAGQAYTAVLRDHASTVRARIAELETQLERATSLAVRDANRVRELEATVERQAARLREWAHQDDEDGAIIEGLAAAARRLAQRDAPELDRLRRLVATQAADYRLARARIAELEDERAPLRGAARDMVSAMRGFGGSDHIDSCVDHLADVVGMPAAPQAVAVPDLEVRDRLDAREALLVVGLDLPKMLDGDVLTVREYEPGPDGGPYRVRVIGTLLRQDGAYRLAVGSASTLQRVIPPAAVPAYVDAVRAAGFPSPTWRCELRARVLGMRELEPSAG